jgi:hypothetical protein
MRAVPDMKTNAITNTAMAGNALLENGFFNIKYLEFIPSAR